MEEMEEESFPPQHTTCRGRVPRDMEAASCVGALNPTVNCEASCKTHFSNH